MNETLNERLLIILSSPSGAGKSTLARLLAKDDPEIQVSISATTRSPRDNENEGQEYFFITRKKFENQIESGDFLEYAEVFGNLYGTPLKFIEDCQMKKLDVVFDIDWQGSLQIKNSKYKNNVVSIFILPPSIKELNNRLESRGADSRSMIKGRMEKCRDEISHWKDYQYVLINTQVDEVMDQIKSIVSAERLKRTRRKGLANFVDKLNNELKDKNS
ncbi:MAG: guanylate kinase [Paracoccaceae bacterium]|nr:guanylate kinase [Paracoccaceae bacterium]MDE2675547.1 guanylate kinase [Paracoccaceae bacterium]MXZ50502.1 guanylate kinase [Paracoccaceae bacterium]MYF47238.1 guanylate kinase [Paracoccaceae bacterium]MYI92110.1 guanylate kinase [Paracoccaceae bacterium]